MSDLVTSETVTEEVQPETQVKFKKPLPARLWQCKGSNKLIRISKMGRI